MAFALLLGLVAAFGWGTTDITGAIAARRVGSLRVQVGALGASTIAICIFALLRPELLGAEPMGGIWLGGLIGAFASIAYIAYLTALRLGPLAVVSPVVSTYGGVTVLLAVLIRGEQVLPLQAVGALMAVIGVALTSVVVEPGAWDGSRGHARLVGPGVILAGVASLVFGSLGVLLADPIATYGPVPTLIGGRLGNALAGIVLLLVSVASRSNRLRPLLEPNGRLDRRIVVLMVASGLADLVAFAAFSVGVDIGPVWAVGLASSFGPLLVVLYAIGSVGERLRPVQWTGLALIILGVVLIVVTG